MSKNNCKKHILLNVDEKLYYKIRKAAEELCLPVSTWVKLEIAKKLNEKED